MADGGWRRAEGGEKACHPEERQRRGTFCDAIVAKAATSTFEEIPRCRFAAARDDSRFSAVRPPPSALLLPQASFLRPPLSAFGGLGILTHVRATPRSEFACAR